MKNLFLLFTIAVISLIALFILGQSHKIMEKKNYYCAYCGQKFASVNALTAAVCPRHPNGAGKGKHKLYEGSEKTKYLCKYCGQSFNSINAMTAAVCPRHPNGAGKGKHSPAL